MKSDSSEPVVLRFERKAIQAGYRCIAGLDEAGRGALCGPVVASAVVLPRNSFLSNVDDSKRLSAGERELAFESIRRAGADIGIGLARCYEIDRLNILQATKLAMRRALERLKARPDYLLLDAVSLEFCDIPQESLIKGDQRSHSIAAASIVAKVVRDRIMRAWHRAYPAYRFDKHKGYGTREHLDILRRRGPSPIHRMRFKHVYNWRELF